LGNDRNWDTILDLQAIVSDICGLIGRALMFCQFAGEPEAHVGDRAMIFLPFYFLVIA
jgi:hypothetical protein